MDRLHRALTWSGKNAILSLFVITGADQAPPLTPPARYAPEVLRTYRLEDAEGRLGERNLFEYDLIWEGLPERIAELVDAWIRSAIEQGADLAWFGFEGSFDFEHLFSRSVAPQIFAFGIASEVHSALEDAYRLSDRWAEKLEEVRNRLRLG